MPAIINADDGAISGASGLKLSSDTSGVLNIQTNGTTAISISSSQVVSFPSTTSIGTLYFAAGTAAAPSISVTGDTNTGIYFPAADTIAFTEGGVESMRLTSTGQIAASTDGTASAPVFTRSSDLDTGQWFPTANTLAWSTGGSERMRINSSGNVGIGTSAPNAALTIGGGSPRISFFDGDPTYSVYRSSTTMALSSSGPILLAAGSGGTITFTNSAARMHITVGGNIGIGTIDPGATLDVAGNARSNAWIGRANVSAPTADAAVYRAADNTLAFSTANTERARIDSAGNMGLGVTPSAWSSFGPALQMQYGAIKASYFNSTNNQISVLNNAFEAADTSYKYIVSTNKASMYKQIEGAHQWHTAAGGTAGNAITFTQAMTLDASGNLAIGKTSTSYKLGIAVSASASNQSAFEATNQNNASCEILLKTDVATINAGGTGNLAFANGVGVTERARITSGGELLVGKTTTDFSTKGLRLNGPVGQVEGTVDGGYIIAINRLTNDGDLITFWQAGTQEGTISVSGNTVSYNAFAGSHWSQLQDGSKPDILRGTVMESINELCVWPDETNERLPKSKISDTAGSKKVYGVFMAWDNDWTETNDMYVTAVGAFICRVNGSVTVQEGDLLESNGDGTARVQADDIIRSSTIGKVTSTVKTHEYDDGSYCVPTVLYCG